MSRTRTVFSRRIPTAYPLEQTGDGAGSTRLFSLPEHLIFVKEYNGIGDDSAGGGRRPVLRHREDSR